MNNLPTGAVRALNIRPAPRKYHHSEESDAVIRDRYDGRIRNRTLAIARTLGWPKWVVCKRAAELGCTRPKTTERRPWSAAEEKFLLINAGSRTAIWMARKLGRSFSSTVLKLKRMKISRMVTDGYTKTALAACFGIDGRIVDGWAREGKLQTGRREGLTREVWQVSEAEVLRFLRDNPETFRLDKVDQVWFMDLIAPGMPAAIKAAEGRA